MAYFRCLGNSNKRTLVYTLTAGNQWESFANPETSNYFEVEAHYTGTNSSNVPEEITKTYTVVVEALNGYVDLDTKKVVSVVENDDIRNDNLKDNGNISEVVQATGETTQVPIPTGFEYMLGTGVQRIFSFKYFNQAG